MNNLNSASLADESSYFTSLLHQTPIAIIHYEAIRDEHGRVVNFRFRFINRAGAALSGRTPDEITNRTMSEVAPDMLTDESFGHFVRAIDTGQEIKYEQFYQDPHSAGWFAVTINPSGDGVLVTVQNITLQRQAEQQLQRQTKLLQEVIDLAPAAVTVLTAVRNEAAGDIIDFEFTLSNHEAHRLGKLSAGQSHVGRRMLTMHPEAKQTEGFGKLRQVVETGEPVAFEVLHNIRDVDFHLWLTAAKFDDGLILIAMDITALKQAELEKQQQADLLLSIIDNSPSAIVLFEPVRDETGRVIDARFTLANPAAVEAMGMPLVHMNGKTLHTLFPASAIKTLFNRLVLVWETGETQRFEQQRTPANAGVWAKVTLVRQNDNVLGVFEFVTELKAAQRQLEQQNNALAQSNDSLLSFAYVASHDLQEPLRKIEQFGDILLERHAPALGPQGLHLVERMTSAAGRMSVLIRDLLTLARVTTEPHPFRLIDLNALVADVLGDLEATIQQAGAIVDVGTLCIVQGDELQLRQLLQNLLSNAFKFAKPSAAEPHRVQIGCREVSADELPSEVKPTSGHPVYYKITITDNGIGFAPEQAERIFGAFQRLHARSQYEGTGIGLAIARKVIDRHGGVITAESQPGQGATFTAYLPVQ